jgi:hypothetical protein
VIDDEYLRDIIVGIFDVNRRLHRIAGDVRVIRQEPLEEDDDGEEEEGDQR